MKKKIWKERVKCCKNSRQRYSWDTEKWDGRWHYEHKGTGYKTKMRSIAFWFYGFGPYDERPLTSDLVVTHRTGFATIHNPAKTAQLTKKMYSFVEILILTWWILIGWPWIGTKDNALNLLFLHAFPILITIQNSKYYIMLIDWWKREIHTVMMHMGRCCLHWTHTSSIDGMAVLQNGHGVKSSSASVEPLGGRRTVLSIFFLYFASSWSLYSGFIKMAAYWNAAFFNPARSHSMTVEVRIGTTSTDKHFKLIKYERHW